MCKGPVAEGIKVRSRVKEGWCDWHGGRDAECWRGSQGGRQGPDHQGLEGMSSSFSERWAARQGCKDVDQGIT